MGSGQAQAGFGICPRKSGETHTVEISKESTGLVAMICQAGKKLLEASGMV